MTPLKNIAVRFLPILLIVAVASAAEAPPWREAAPGYAWSFPRDLYAHPDYKTEWWYLTGHLRPVGDAESEPLGFQFTIFRVGLQPDGGNAGSAWTPTDLIMAHAALTDPADNAHVFSETIHRATPFLGGFGAPGDSRIAWCRAPAGTDADWSIDYRNGVYRLRARDDARGLRYDLRCTPVGERIFHGPGGFSPKTADGASGSLYFSRPRMRVEGEIHRKGEVVEVSGDSWLDREIFTSTLSDRQTGWDWLALNLEDGRDLMLYRLRNAEGREDFALGTLIDRDGSTRTLEAADWDLEVLDHWTSPETGARYPVRWRLTIPDADLDLWIRAVIPRQENVSERTGIHYWEGAVTVHPDSAPERGIGRGFVELTGYGDGSRPPV